MKIAYFLFNKITQLYAFLKARMLVGAYVFENPEKTTDIGRLK